MMSESTKTSLSTIKWEHAVELARQSETLDAAVTLAEESLVGLGAEQQELKELREKSIQKWKQEQEDNQRKWAHQKLDLLRKLADFYQDNESVSLQEEFNHEVVNQWGQEALDELLAAYPDPVTRPSVTWDNIEARTQPESKSPWQRLWQPLRTFFQNCIQTLSKNAKLWLKSVYTRPFKWFIIGLAALFFFFNFRYFNLRTLVNSQLQKWGVTIDLPGQAYSKVHALKSKASVSEIRIETRKISNTIGTLNTFQYISEELIKEDLPKQSRCRLLTALQTMLKERNDIRMDERWLTWFALWEPNWSFYNGIMKHHSAGPQHYQAPHAFRLLRPPFVYHQKQMTDVGSVLKDLDKFRKMRKHAPVSLSLECPRKHSFRYLRMSGFHFDHSLLSQAQLASTDFSFSSFAKSDLSSALFKGAVLEQTNFDHTDLRGADFRFSRLSNDPVLGETGSSSGSAKRSTIPKGASFSGALLAGAKFNQTLLRNSHFSNARLQPLLFDTTRKRSEKEESVTFWGADLSGSKTNFSNAHLPRANFRMTILRGADLSRAELPGASFWKADLSNAKLQYAKLPRTQFQQATLRNADLSHAVLINADLRNADFSAKQQKSKQTLLKHTHLRFARLSGARFHNANLTKADLSYAILDQSTRFGGTNLYGAKLTGTNIRLLHNKKQKANKTLKMLRDDEVTQLDSVLIDGQALGGDPRREQLSAQLSHYRFICIPHEQGLPPRDTKRGRIDKRGSVESGSFALRVHALCADKPLMDLKWKGPLSCDKLCKRHKKKKQNACHSLCMKVCKVSFPKQPKEKKRAIPKTIYVATQGRFYQMCDVFVNRLKKDSTFDIIHKGKRRSRPQNHSSPKAQKVRIDSKSFRESKILASLLMTLLVKTKDYWPTRQNRKKFRKRPPSIVKQNADLWAKKASRTQLLEYISFPTRSAQLWNAILQGRVDIYPEYTKTLAVELLHLEKTPTIQTLRGILKRYGIGITGRLGFGNGFVVVMLRKKAKGINKISDLAKHPKLRIGLTPQFIRRRDGWKAMRSLYQLRLKKTVEVEYSQAYQKLNDGEVDAVIAYQTDPELQSALAQRKPLSRTAHKQTTTKTTKAAKTTKTTKTTKVAKVAKVTKATKATKAAKAAKESERKHLKTTNRGSRTQGSRYIVLHDDKGLSANRYQAVFLYRLRLPNWIKRRIHLLEGKLTQEKMFVLNAKLPKITRELEGQPELLRGRARLAVTPFVKSLIDKHRPHGIKCKPTCAIGGKSYGPNKKNRQKK